MHRVKSNELRKILDDKIKYELQQDMLSIVPQSLECNHSIFGIPKEDGSGRLIVDCSQPKGASVNTYVDSVCEI